MSELILPSGRLEDYERFLVYSNPVSRHAAGLGADTEVLHALAAPGHKAVVVEDTWPSYDETLEDLDKKSEAGDIVVIRGGDGAAGTLLSALTVLDRNLPVLVIPRGNANDLAHMLYHGDFYDNPGAILDQQTVEALHPLAITATQEDETTTTLAWTYFTLGSSALAAYYYNQPEYRQSRWHKVPGDVGTYIKERLTAVHAYFANPRFYLETPEGDRKRLQDRIIALGARMAKDFKLNADLFEADNRLIDVRNKFTGFATLQGLLGGKELGALFDNELRFSVEGQPTVYSQIGGEHQLFEGIVNFIVRPADESVPVFTARNTDQN